MIPSFSLCFNNDVLFKQYRKWGSRTGEYKLEVGITSSIHGSQRYRFKYCHLIAE